MIPANSAAIKPTCVNLKILAIKITGTTNNEPRKAGMKRISVSNEIGNTLAKKAVMIDAAVATGDKSFSS